MPQRPLSDNQNAVSPRVCQVDTLPKPGKAPPRPRGRPKGFTVYPPHALILEAEKRGIKLGTDYFVSLMRRDLNLAPSGDCSTCPHEKLARALYASTMVIGADQK